MKWNWKTKAVHALRRTLRESTDFLRRMTAPGDGVGGVTLSCVCPHCHCFPLGDHIWWVSSGHGEGNKKRKRSNAIGVQLAAARRARTESWSHKTARTAQKQKVLRAHAAPQGMCGNLVNALKPFGEPAERWNYAAVKIRDLETETRSKKVVKPNFTTDYPGAFIREGADELTLRAHEEGGGAFFHRPHKCGEQEMGATARARGLARFLPGHFSRESKDRSGKPRIINTGSCTKRLKVRIPMNSKRPKDFWALKEAKRQRN